MRAPNAKWTALSAVMTLTACAAGTPPMPSAPNPSPIESVTVSVGPCFGFCPVYDATIASNGLVSFVGSRHTAVLGERRLNVGADAYRTVADELAVFRPAAGTEARIQCDAAISDMSAYTIRWQGSDGQVTVATLQSRCPAGPGARLDAILRGLPGRLGIEEWAKQTTRPGESRG